MCCQLVTRFDNGILQTLTYKCIFLKIFSSPEPKAHWWLTGYVGLHLLSICLLSTLFKHLLLRNRLANQSQISYGASMGWGNESLLKRSRSHDQDGHHAQRANDLETSYAASGAQVLPSLFKLCPWVDLDLKFGPLCFCMGKSENNGFFRNYCSPWYKSW